MPNLPGICVVLKILFSEYQSHMPVVKFFTRLDPEQICLFLDEH